MDQAGVAPKGVRLPTSKCVSEADRAGVVSHQRLVQISELVVERPHVANSPTDPNARYPPQSLPESGEFPLFSSGISTWSAGFASGREPPWATPLHPRSSTRPR